MNANHFIKCQSCGAEFPSAFAGARVAVGCTEACPYCSAKIATPLLFEDRNGTLLQDACDTPMIREFGENGRDGYVFMGRGILHFQVTASQLIPIHGAYTRNTSRTLELMDAHYVAPVIIKQISLSGIYCSIMTKYECMIRDVYNSLENFNLITKSNNRSGNLDIKRDDLINSLGCKLEEHITSLRYLAAFRNCISHKHGIVDEKFLTDIAAIGPIPPILSRYRVGTPLVLDPSAATSFTNSVQLVAHSIFPAAQTFLEEAGI